MADTPTLTFTIGGTPYTMVEPDDLELGEIEQIEDAFNLPFEEIDLRRTKTLRFLLFFSIRRAGGKTTMDDLASVPIVGLDVEEANGKRPTKPRPKAKPG